MKKKLSKEQIYKRNQKIEKIIKIATPIVFWLFIALAVLFLVLAVQNSFGNCSEIINKLDNKIYNDEQLQANYNELIEKYGEWTIGSGGSGFVIHFINIGKALFSGLMIVNLIFSITFAILSVLLGKWLMPYLARKMEQKNSDMVNLEILRKSEE